MKKTICIVLVLLVSLIAVANAETDMSSMTDEELYALRVQINQELASRNRNTNIPEGATIADLFPDTVFAKQIRDSIGAFSINDIVTQERLSKVDSVHFLNKNDGLTNLEGIQYLTNLRSLLLYYLSGLNEIPEEIGELLYLREISFEKCGISKLPDSICNLVNLTWFDISYTDISSLPNDFGNLSALKELDISHTRITSLPESIYSLTLEKFEREGLDFD